MNSPKSILSFTASSLSGSDLNPSDLLGDTPASGLGLEVERILGLGVCAGEGSL